MPCEFERCIFWIHTRSLCFLGRRQVVIQIPLRCTYLCYVAEYRYMQLLTATACHVIMESNLLILLVDVVCRLTIYALAFFSSYCSNFADSLAGSSPFW